MSDNVVQFPGTEHVEEPTEAQIAAANEIELDTLHAAPPELLRLCHRLGRYQKLVDMGAPTVIIDGERDLIKRALPSAMVTLAVRVAFEFNIIDIATGEMKGDNR